jgi:hypothetical protein
VRLRKEQCLIALLLASVAYAGDSPDPKLTPGLANPKLTQQKICDKNFRTTSVRNVSEKTKKQVYAAYDMAPAKAPCPCEVDHLISLELGGSNDATNLWPQSYSTMPWNARVKDALETHLHFLVCQGELTLAEAQKEISNNWIAAYQKRREEIALALERGLYTIKPPEK